MNRRKFGFDLIQGGAAMTLVPWAGCLLRPSAEAAPGWSSAGAARRLTGARFRVDNAPGTLELVEVERYRGDERQFTACFRRRGPALGEGIHRLRIGGTHVDLFLQPVHGRDDALEAVVCHAHG